MTSPVPFLSDQEYSALPFPERALMVAASLVGKEESPRGSNWGPFVESLLRRAGLNAPAPWCAAFVSWCVIEAGANNKALWGHRAATYYLWNWGVSTKRFSVTPKRGDIFVYNGPSGGHTGFVTKVKFAGLYIETIEGNTNDGGSREGYAVCRRTRSVASITKHPRWAFVDIEGLDK
jgi:hypothetical protein